MNGDHISTMIQPCCKPGLEHHNRKVTINIKQEQFLITSVPVPAETGFWNKKMGPVG